MIEIDGAFHEGGGQILRTSLALACCTGQAIRVTQIRANRKPPGLKAQHLASVKAAAEISGAEVEGARLSSSELIFSPGPVRPGIWRLEVGTAGAAPLVFHTLVYPLAAAGGESSVEIAGGTHVPWAPTCPYLEEVWAWWYRRFGGAVDLACGPAGFFPRGGGKMRARIGPAGAPAGGLSPVERGPLESLAVWSQASTDLPEHVVQRQLHGAAAALAGREFERRPAALASRSTGTAVLVVATYAGSRAGFQALGERGKPAEAVGREAAAGFARFDDGRAALDRHLADQVLLMAALAPAALPFQYTTEEVTGHLITNADTIGRFLPVSIEVTGAEGEPGTVTVRVR